MRTLSSSTLLPGRWETTIGEGNQVSIRARSIPSTSGPRWSRLAVGSSNAWFRRIPPALRRVASAHVAALLATLVAVVASPSGVTEDAGPAIMGVAVFVGFAVLRVRSVGRQLALSTLVLDGLGTAVFLAGTDAPASPYFFVALAGAWWAAHTPRRGSGLTWAATFGLIYAVLVIPGAVRDGSLVHALEDASVVVIVGLLADWFVRIDRRALELSEALANAPAGAENLAIREGLSRALGPMEIPLDVLLTAARKGFTVIQAELLAYLAMGLTNQEIADATNVGEATVRYRLTALYRALEVRGRKAAVASAHENGLVPAEVPIRRRLRT